MICAFTGHRNIKYEHKVRMADLLYRAINYEIQRQKDILDDGGVIVQETRKWDDDKGKSSSMRSKEHAQDYRYFPDPDLMPITITYDDISKIKEEMVTLPADRRKKYVEEFGISWGNQLLGAILFFVPRSIWPSKPLGTGHTAIVALDQHYFSNVSAPLIAEGYVNFGIVGVVLFALAAGWIFRKLDSAFWCRRE